MTDVEAIYRKYSPDVYRFACWLSGNPSEAEEIVSETFLRLWGSTDSLELSTVKAYLLTIARNLVLTRARRERKRAPLPDEVLDAMPPPDVQAEQKEELRMTLRAIQTLSVDERAALMMRFEHQLPYDEIARSLGISLSAAKVRVHRARLKLAERLIPPGDRTCQ